MKPREKTHYIVYLLMPVLGAVFCFWYIHKAGADVVYSDYIRIIHEYLPDVADITKIFTPDILTRTPLYFAQRYVNVQSFGFSVVFDRICTIAGICFMAAVMARFALRERVKLFWYLCMMIVLFSLSKWEVFMNGTCWPHMVAIGLFFVNYELFDRIWKGESDALVELSACVMPFLWLLVAGEYIASYAVSMILVSLYGALTGGAVNTGSRRVQKVFVRIGICTALSLLLYIISRSFAEWEHAGASDMTLFEMLLYAPSFLPRFFLKSLAGTVLGAETFSVLWKGGPVPDVFIYLTGALVFLGYAAAFFVYFRHDMSEKTVFPLILLISGFVNHALVTYARWIFLNENYGLSSRYAGQFMVGILGILSVFSLYRIPVRRGRNRVSENTMRKTRVFLILFAVLVAAGNIYTSLQEIQKAKYRKANYEQMAQMILDYENTDTEELCRMLEWHKDPEILTESLGILAENSLNVFYPMNAAGMDLQKEITEEP